MGKIHIFVVVDFNMIVSIVFVFVKVLCVVVILIIDQGLSKHQEVCFTPLTKVEKLIVIFCDLFGAI